jgi:hypothetical protein
MDTTKTRADDVAAKKKGRAIKRPAGTFLTPQVSV